MSRSLVRSEEWWARAQRVIPLGTQTLSKSPTQYVRGIAPKYLVRGKGAHVWDVDGNEYVDFPMALGPVLLGHAEPLVDAAIRRQLEDGIVHTLLHPLEVEVAERLVELCPGVEAVRFGKSGSDALSAAIRAARALTGRDRVLVSGYHGWHDWYIGSTSRGTGVPPQVAALTVTFPYGDSVALERALEEWRGEVAAVVIEPSGAETPPPGYLQDVVDLARNAGALSVFDEVITGFRLAPGGARQAYGVIPDISCYGKALGNGMPISAVAGSWSVMEVFEDVFFSGTHGGETLSLAAAAAVLDAVRDGSVLARMAEQGRRLKQGMTDVARAYGVEHVVLIGGEAVRPVVRFAGDDLVMKTWVQQCLLDEGVLFNGSMFICARHSEQDLEAALRGFDRAFAAISAGDFAARLQGPPVEPVFRAP